LEEPDGRVWVVGCPSRRGGAVVRHGPDDAYRAGIAWRRARATSTAADLCQLYRRQQPVVTVPHARANDRKVVETVNSKTDRD
jgi:hypothetical protein